MTRVMNWIFERCLVVLDWPRAFFISAEKLVLIEQPGRQKSVLEKNTRVSRKRLCIFSHYNGQGRIAGSTWHYLEQLELCGCDIIFVSTSPVDAGGESWDKLLDCCSMVITRKNAGYDFGSWKTGYVSSKNILENYQDIVLANDSVYGPFWSLEDYFNTMDARENLDVWGFTDSYENRYHLQSYFLVFRLDAAVKSFLDTFFENYPMLSQRRSVVLRGELALASLMKKCDLRMAALIPFGNLVEASTSETVAASKNCSHVEFTANPVISYWKELIQQYKFPFIKREVLRNQYASQQDDWKKLIPQDSLLTVDEIERSFALQ